MRNPTRLRTSLATDVVAPREAGRAAPIGTQAWWRVPAAWLGIAIFALSLVGCVLMIILAERHADEPLPVAGGEVLHVPIARPPGTGNPKAGR